MSCVSLEQLAAMDDAAIAHAATCDRCAAVLAEQRAIRQLAQAMRSPRLSADRRAVLAAEVMAQADVEVSPRRYGFAIAAAGSLAAALVVIVLATRTQGAEPVPSVPVVDEHVVALSSRSTTAESIPAEALAQLAGEADLTRDTTPERDVITLRGGSVSIDSSYTRPVQIVAGATRVGVARAKASVVARAGVIDHVAVFAGSVEVTTGGTRHVIVAGETWDRLPQPKPVPQPASSLAAFRDGWTLFRSAKFEAALAAFDRATDPVVAEDAAYWAAVATERLGQTAEARRRFTEFVATFPDSPRAEAARAAIARL